MNTLNSYNFTTSPLSQPARKLRRLENPTLRSLRTRELKVRRLGEIYNRRNLNKKYSVISVVKELDAETGLYYYGARYLDPRTSRWLSGDPAIYEGDYLPSAPINDEVRKRNQNLPGMGGIFNHVNMHVYHYGGNNPVKYIDPDGRISIKIVRSFVVGKIPVMARADIGYSNGVITFDIKAGIGVGYGASVDLSSLISSNPQTPATGIRAGLYTQGSASFELLSMKSEITSTRTHIEFENGRITKIGEDSMIISVNPQPFITTEYTVDPRGNTTIRQRESLSFGNETSMLLIGIGVDGGVRIHE